jgi:pyruvate/2-oxoglutarate/acetoin dehydrogenase E1 component
VSAAQLTMPVRAPHFSWREIRRAALAGLAALVHHIPGLKVVYPVTPYDAKGMMNAALAGTDP